MKTLNKNSAYAYLNRIKNESNGEINVSPYFQRVANSETVPYEVLVFINKHIGLPQLYTYNEIYRRRHGNKKNPLYKNLMNENLADEEKATALCSLLTQTFIHIRELTKEGKGEDIQEYANIMNVKEITEALNEFADGDTNKLNEVFMDVRNILRHLYK